MDVITFILANWWWLSPLALTALGGLKIAAKKTKWVADDKVLTLLIGLVKMGGRPMGLLSKILGKGQSR